MRDLSSSPNNEIKEVIINVLKKIKESPVVSKIEEKIKLIENKIKNVEYLSNMVANRDELHKSATNVNMIYQQILFDLKQINIWDEQRLCPDLNFDFLKDNTI